MSMNARYTVIDGEVMSELRSGTKRDYVPNPSGSSVALLDGTSTKTDTFEYWPYGEIADRVGNTATPFQYIGIFGYYRDRNSADYVRARYLDKSRGSWITDDPVLVMRGSYLYADTNPISERDTTGLDPTSGDCLPREKERVRLGIRNACSYIRKARPHYPLTQRVLECMQAWCSLTDTQVFCGHPECSKKSGVCGVGTRPIEMNWRFYLCPRNYKTGYCSDLISKCGLSTVIAHEVAHKCGLTDAPYDNLGHSAVQDAANQCTGCQIILPGTYG
jgi:RHS repeat-associated protein